MPFELIRGAKATVRCPEATCRGHAPQEASVEARTRVWTQRLGAGPITVARSERLPPIVPERHQSCACGKETELTWQGIGPDRLELPEPRLSPAWDQVDEQLAAPPEPLSVEERVAALERSGADR